jgi:hypothetical protein
MNGPVPTGRADLFEHGIKFGAGDKQPTALALETFI